MTKAKWTLQMSVSNFDFVTLVGQKVHCSEYFWKSLGNFCVPLVQSFEISSVMVNLHQLRSNVIFRERKKPIKAKSAE